MNAAEAVSLREFDSATTVKVRTPKRVLHFSDGTLEEYSDEDDTDSTPPSRQTNAELIDASTLSWSSWLIYKAWGFGTVALAACDYMGEGLANFFGITTPKYWAEIEEYKRMQAEKEETEKEAEGWSEPATAVVPNQSDVQLNQPGAVGV